MRRVLTLALTILYTSLLWAVSGLSITQSTIGNGLESQSLNVLAKDRLGRLWVGSDVGISVISNGTVTNIREMVSGGGLVMLGNVNSIVCTESVLIACEDRILHYDPKDGFAETLKYEDRILHTKSFLLEGDVVTFYDSDMRSLFTYDMNKLECRLMASFGGKQDYDFIKILRTETESPVIFLADDNLGLYRFDRQTGTLENVPGTDKPIIAKATAIDRSNVIWLSVPSNGIKGYYINSNYEKVAEYNTRNCKILTDDISLIAPLPNGNLLISQFDKGSCVIEREGINEGRTDVNVIDNLKNVTSTLINSDDKESLYATSGFGLISMRKTFIDEIHYIYEQKDGIINFENYISAFEEPEGTVLLGTSRNGLCRFNPQTQERQRLPEPMV